MKILIADDDPDDRALSLLAFEKLNTASSLDFFESGQQLIGYLTSQVASNSTLPDLILLDLNMPKKDGRETLKELKSHSKLKQVKVFMFSSSDSEKDKKDTKHLGAQTIL